ncbi:MAG: hypothetical protein ACI80P_001694, partial [Flavobacteriales bacterium]
MRYLFTTLFITFFMVFASVFASAQPGQRYTSSNKKAVAIFEDAIRTYELG